MWEMSMTILLTFFRMIYAQNQETIYYQSITEQEAVESLVEISHSQTLPMVLLIKKDSTKLWHPQYLSHVFIDKGRIINKTQFGGRQSPSKQFYFCPKENSPEKCLVHKEFQPLEPLQCSEEAKPILERDEKAKFCGFSDVGTHYELFYEICPNQKPYDFETDDLRQLVYEFCYDAKKKKLLFITHSILHPQLLTSKELQWERNIQYSMENMDEYTLLNQHNSESTIKEKSKELNTKNPIHQNKKQKTGKEVYQKQKLIPTEDLALALWRKYTFRHFNTELQHEKLIELWDEINSNIRRHVENIFISKRIDNYIFTGVFDLSSKPRADGQLSNMWVKMIYFLTYDENYVKRSITHGAVILMNNFIDTKTDSGESSNFQEKTIDYYCEEQDFCAESLKKKFKDVGGRIRCCSKTSKISELFGVVSSIETPMLILIPGVLEITE